MEPGNPVLVDRPGQAAAHVFVSGNAALDFLGTRKWRRSTLEELLVTPLDVDRWFLESGLATAAPGFDVQDLRAVRSLREAIYRLVTQFRVGRAFTPEDVETVNAHAVAPPICYRLAHRGRESSRVTPAAALSSLARVAIELLSSGPDLPLKECARQDCTRLFLDRSRGRSREWCGMDECGNRIKAAAYRQRRRVARRSSTG